MGQTALPPLDVLVPLQAFLRKGLRLVRLRVEEQTSRHIGSNPRRLHVGHRRVHEMHHILERDIRGERVSAVAGGENRTKPIGRRTAHGAAERENGRQRCLQSHGRFILAQRRQDGAQPHVAELAHGVAAEETRDGGDEADVDVAEENAAKKVENAVFRTAAAFQKGDQLRAKLQVQAFRRHAGLSVAYVEEILRPDALRPFVPVFLHQIGR